MPRPTLTAPAKAELLEKQRRSGLTVRESCRREGITEAASYAWRLQVGCRLPLATEPATPPAVRPATSSGSVSSLPLPDALAPHFRLLDHRPQLGTLLQRVLAVAEPLLDPEDDRDAAFLRLLCWYEETLTDAGVIPAEYACFVAVRTGAPAG